MPRPIECKDPFAADAPTVLSLTVLSTFTETVRQIGGIGEMFTPIDNFHVSLRHPHQWVKTATVVGITDLEHEDSRPFILEMVQRGSNLRLRGKWSAGRASHNGYYEPVPGRWSCVVLLFFEDETDALTAKMLL